MITKPTKIYVSNLSIDTVKKDIKNMHLGVYPPHGRVRVAAPLRTPDQVIRLFVISKMHWIKKQQLKYLQQERESKREYVAGESHHLFGKRYRLNIIHTNTKSKVEIQNMNYIDLHIKSNTNQYQRQAIIEKYYRSELQKLIPRMQERWQKKLRVQASEVRIKRMRTKWGACNKEDRRIWLNLELSKKSIRCIEYVFVHELAHLIENNHSERFIRLLETLLPHWHQIKKELNCEPLGYSGWD